MATDLSASEKSLPRWPLYKQILECVPTSGQLPVSAYSALPTALAVVPVFLSMSYHDLLVSSPL
jgi:hypothetical protein